jgi:RNA polymerase sigma factor (TIGR02999 family)
MRAGKLLRVQVPPNNSVTLLLQAWGRGDDSALDRLTPLVYDELRKIARAYMAQERRPGHTLQPTALINEAYIRLVDIQHPDWQNRTHFYALAAQLMRRILVDFARSRQYQKRGGGRRRVTLDDVGVSERGPDLVALDDALTALAAIDPRKSRVVEMRFFGGMSAQETAAILQLSSKTVLREWQTAKVWLLKELSNRDSSRRVP